VERATCANSGQFRRASEGHRQGCVSRNLDGLLSVTADPGSDILDGIEPIEQTTEYREAAQKCLTFMNSLLDWQAAYSTPGELEARLWSMLAVIQHPVCEGKRLSEFGELLQITRANLSKHVVIFERIHALTPNFGAECTRARAAYMRVHATEPSRSRRAWLRRTQLRNS
jgi:hypothetical protein